MASSAASDEDKVPLFSLLENGEMKEHGPDDWIRPLGKSEQFMGVACYLKCSNTNQAIWLASEEPLSKTLLDTALTLLVTRIPTLNICIQRRWFLPWFRRMSHIAIDFEIVSGDPKTVFLDTLEKTYSMYEGPLWHVRMVRLSPNQRSPRGITAKNHVMIVFAIHHVITDSATNMTICKEFVDILNDLQAHKPSLIKPYPFSPPYAEKMVPTSNMDLFRITIDYLYELAFGDIKSKITFNNVIPLPKNYEQAKMNYICHVFSESTTEKLISQCKINFTSVHSAIVRATNAAYLTVVKKRSTKSVDELSVLYIDCIDLRRYYPKHDREHIGCHVTILNKEEKVSTELKKQFWETARSSKKLLHDELESLDALRVIPIVKIASFILPMNIYNNRKKLTNVCDKHYSTSNMCDVTWRFRESPSSDRIRITDISRCSDFTMTSGQLFGLTFHTFRNRLYLSIEHSSSKMSENVSSELFENMKNNVLQLAEEGKL